VEDQIWSFSTSRSVQLQLNREVVLDGRNDTGDELEEEEHVELDAWLTAVVSDLIADLLHHGSVVAWMYTELLTSLLRMRLESDSLVGIVCHDVHKHLLLSQDVTFLAVTKEPKSRCLVVKVICNAQVVLSNFLNCVSSVDFHVIAEVIFCHVCALCENIIRLRFVFLFFFHLSHHVVHVSDFFLLLFFRLLSPIWHHLRIHVHWRVLARWIVVDSFCPTITKIDLLDAFSRILDVFDTSRAGNFLSDKELLLIGEPLVKLISGAAHPLPSVTLVSQIISSYDKLFRSEHTFLEELALFKGADERCHHGRVALIYRILD